METLLPHPPNAKGHRPRDGGWPYRSCLEFGGIGGIILEANDGGGCVKRQLSLMFWAVGSGGAVLWAVWWVGCFVYAIVTRHHSVGAFLRSLLLLLPAAIGVELARQGFATFRAEKNAK